MKLGYTILYVDDVSKTVEFYEKAFGLNRGFVDESNTYGEMDTGETKLAFAAIELGKTHGPAFAELKKPTTVPPFEIALVTKDVDSAFKTAVNSGAVAIEKPAQKPWGQWVAYLKDLNGFFVEICSPMSEEE